MNEYAYNTDTVDHPSHYNQLELECQDVVRCMGFTLGNAVKYLWRSPFKGKEQEDIKKALWYLKDFLANTPRNLEMPNQTLRALIRSYRNTLLSSDMAKELYNADILHCIIELLLAQQGMYETQTREELLEFSSGNAKFVVKHVIQDLNKYLRELDKYQ